MDIGLGDCCGCGVFGRGPDRHVRHASGDLVDAMLVQEMVMAVWLIVKGFNASAIAPGSAKTPTNEPLGAA